MSVASVVARGRAAAERRMTDFGVVHRPGDITDATPDPVTGKVTQPLTTVYTGKARVRPAASAARASAGSGVDAGEERLAKTSWIVALPANTVGPRPGDIWATTASTNPLVAGAKFRVSEILAAAQHTELRMLCELVERRLP